MNRLNPRSWSLGTKLFIGLIIVSLLPIITLIIVTARNRTELAIERSAPYVVQLTLRQQQAIQHTFGQALVEFEAFIADAEGMRAVTQALTFLRDEGRTVQARSAAEFARQTFRRTLLDNEEVFFDAVYLLSQTGASTALTTAVGRSNPAVEEDMRNSDIFLLGRDLLTLAGNERELILSRRDGGVQLEVVRSVPDDDGVVVGYVVVALNLDTVIYNHIGGDASVPDVYSFVILPTNDDFVALPEVRERVSFNSIGVQRALRGEASTALSYVTGGDADAREVLGYYVPVQLLDKRFAMVTEYPTAGIIRVDQENAFGGLVLALIGVALLGGVVNVILTTHIDNPLKHIERSSAQMVRGDYGVSVAQYQDRVDSVGSLARTHEAMRAQLAQTLETLAERLEARTRDVRLTQDIGRTITGERDLQRMMDGVVYLITDNFPTIYHAQIFLPDDNNYAVLRASTGDAGRALLERGHKLEIGSVSVIGQVMEQGEVVLARDTAMSDVHRRNEFLQDTRAELAIPLRVENRVIGALDVQSRYPDAFPDDQIAVLMTLANSIAIAIENIRLFEESYRQMRQVEVERRNRTQLDWDTYLRPDEKTYYTSRAGNITSYRFEDLRRAVYQSGQAIVGGETPNGTIPFAVPIRLRDQILGIAEYELPGNEFRYDKVLLAEELVNRLAISLDNARLFRESQLSAERERIVNEISAKLQGQTDIESILETAVREVSYALRSARVGIELQFDQSNGHTSESDEEDVS